MPEGFSLIVVLLCELTVKTHHLFGAVIRKAALETKAKFYAMIEILVLHGLPVRTVWAGREILKLFSNECLSELT